MNTNLHFPTAAADAPSGGHVVEVQLHLRAVFEAGLEIHKLYEVAGSRAADGTLSHLETGQFPAPRAERKEEQRKVVLAL